MTFLIFLGLAFSLIKDGSSMFSPGDLTDLGSAGKTLDGFMSHAEFEKECRYCHDPLQTTQADLCVRCHSNIMKQVVDQSGPHAKIKNLPECRACHPDHRGRDFDTVVFAYALFDHELSNFTLSWHQVAYDLSPIICADCHTQGGFDLKPNACQDCHEEDDPNFMVQHKTNFGDDCLACHDGSGNLANFDHSTTLFPLDGEHNQIECVDCHTDGQFSDLPRACLDCHAEPKIHAGLFSANCETCHTAIDWAVIVGLNGQIFDHFESSQFSLERHLINYTDQPMVCSDCHTSPDGFKVTFELQFCTDCHFSEDAAFVEAHLEQFGTDCLVCHDGVDRMHNFDHERLFPLDGAHTEVDCVLCHIDQVFIGTPSTCANCHSEPEIHAGVFGLQCETCHSSAAWSPAQMVEHTFPLDHGEQGLVSCETCHVNRYIEYTCYGCHEHQAGEILSKHLEEGISQAEIAACMDCHPDGREHNE